jgi:hypothetical protein
MSPTLPCSESSKSISPKKKKSLTKLQGQNSPIKLNKFSSMPKAKEIRAMVKQAFNQYDLDKSGFLEHEEIKKLLNDANSQSGGQSMSNLQIEQIIRTVDNNGDGMFSEEELFCALEPIVKNFYKSFEGFARSATTGLGKKRTPSFERLLASPRKKSKWEPESLDGSVLEKQLKYVNAQSPGKKINEDRLGLREGSQNSIEQKNYLNESDNRSGPSIKDLGSGKSINDIVSPHSASNLEIVASKYMSANVIEEMSFSDGGSDSLPVRDTSLEKIGADEKSQILGLGSGATLEGFNIPLQRRSRTLDPSSVFFSNERIPKPHIVLGCGDESPLPEVFRSPIKEPSNLRNKKLMPFEIQIKPPNSRRGSDNNSYKQIDHNLLNIGQPSTLKLLQPTLSNASKFSESGQRSQKSVNFNFDRERDSSSPVSLVTQSNRILVEKPPVKYATMTGTPSPLQFGSDLQIP